MAEMGNKFGAIVPLVKESAWWRATDVTLYKGELAWELKSAGGAVTEAFMLVGDGKPANPNHERLRVSGDNIMVSFNGGNVTINTALQTLTQMFNTAEDHYNQIIAAFTGVLTANNIQANSISFPASQGSNAPTYIDKDRVKTPKVETETGVIQTANIGNANISGNASVQGTLDATSAEVSGNQTVGGSETVGGTLEVTGKITGSNGLEVANGQTILKDTQVNGSLSAASAEVSGNQTVGGSETVGGTLQAQELDVLGDAAIHGTLHLNNIATAGAANIGGKITGNAGLEITAGQTILKDTQVNGALGAASVNISSGTASLDVLNAFTGVLHSLTTQAATMHGVTAIDEIRTALIKNPNGQRILLQWASGNLTLGNLLDHLKLSSSFRPKVQDTGGTHEVAYLDDLVGNILFQFGLYSIGEHQTNLPPVNQDRPPNLNEKAIVKSWSNGLPAYVKWNGTAWVYDSLVNKPDDYAWEWVVKNYRDSVQEHYASVFVIYSHEELWSIVDIPLELYRPFAEQNVIDNNAKEWIRFAHNFIPDWLARETPQRISSADTGANGPGRHAPDTDKSGLILNKPPLLSDIMGMNSIDGGDEESEAFNQENWGDHAWGFIVDGGDETYDHVFRYHIDGGNELFIPFWYNRHYPTIEEAEAI